MQLARYDSVRTCNERNPVLVDLLDNGEMTVNQDDLARFELFSNFLRVHDATTQAYNACT